jgi:hypothetical protein
MAKTIDLRRAYSVAVNNPSTGLATETTLTLISTQADEQTTLLQAILRQNEVNQNIIEELKIQTELLKELNT